MRFPLLSKAAVLAALMIVLLVALWRVQGLVSERQERQAQAQQSVADSLAGPQTLLGPVLTMRCDETWPHEQVQGLERKMVTEHRTLQVSAWPRSLSVDAGTAIEPRYRGLFKVNGYFAKSRLVAQWDSSALAPPVPEHDGAHLSCQPPVLAVALSDARGIRGADVRIGDSAVEVLPGSTLQAQGEGFHVMLPAASAGGPLKMTLALELAGTRSLAWTPVAQDTEVRLSSPWPHPSFGGRFLPVERQVGTHGFVARWRVSGLATTAQQAADAGAPACAWGDEGAVPAGSGAACVDAFGVGFIDPVNGYVLSDRAVKYGLLFIALTFVAVALVEALRRLRVHPIQYLLVGSALTIFFLLLLSLGEHLAFGVAYAVAASACTALLAFYGAYLLHGARPGLLFGAGIGLLYGALYAVLQMEQAALVLGSVLLFAVLAAVMIATRRIDWYVLAGELRSGAGTGAAAPVAPANPLAL